MDDFVYESTSAKSIFLKLLFILFFIGLCLGIFLYYKHQNVIELKNITIELGEPLSKNVEDYITNGFNNVKSYKLYLNDVDTSKVGTYTYKVKYNKHTKTGKIKIVDTTKPVVKAETLTIDTNFDLKPDMLILSCDDYSLPCKATFKNTNDLKKLKTPGTYKIDIIVADSAKNKATVTATVEVNNSKEMSSIKSNDLNYYSNSENDDTIEEKFFIKFDTAIDENSDEFRETFEDLTLTDFNEYVDGEIESTKIIIAYNKYNYVIGLQVLITFKDGSSTLLEKLG